MHIQRNTMLFLEVTLVVVDVMVLRGSGEVRKVKH